jgi:hypothetical protein
MGACGQVKHGKWLNECMHMEANHTSLQLHVGIHRGMECIKHTMQQAKKPIEKLNQQW